MKLFAGRITGFGGGVLFFCPDTKRFLWLKRSENSDEPGTWCVPGGGIEYHETIEQGVARECLEEIGYKEPLNLQHMYRDVQSDFVYHNHLATVDKEFTPVLNDEHTEYLWSQQPPQPIHPRLAYSLEQWVKRFRGGNHGTN